MQTLTTTSERFSAGDLVSIVESAGTDRGVTFERITIVPRLGRSGYLGSMSGSGCWSSRRATDAVVTSCREVARTTETRMAYCETGRRDGEMYDVTTVTYEISYEISE